MSHVRVYIWPSLLTQDGLAKSQYYTTATHRSIFCVTQDISTYLYHHVLAEIPQSCLYILQRMHFDNL